MKTYEVVAYACDGTLYCPRCIEESKCLTDEPSPVFADEIEEEDVCDTCHENLGGEL